MSEAIVEHKSWWHRFSERFVRLLDDGLKVPGTEIRFGLDAILGLILPAAGDTVTGVGSLSLLAMALREGVPTVILLRMIGNIAIDVGLGAVPIVGDAFDLVWKSNRRNLNLIKEYSDPKAKPGALDYLLVSLGVTLAVASVIVPFVMLYYVGVKLGPELFQC